MPPSLGASLSSNTAQFQDLVQVQTPQDHRANPDHLPLRQSQDATLPRKAQGHTNYMHPHSNAIALPSWRRPLKLER